MIPPSYLFRGIFRDHFEEDRPQEVEPRFSSGRLSLDGVTAAILSFAYAAAHLALGAGPVARHDRRR